MLESTLATALQPAPFMKSLLIVRLVPLSRLWRFHPLPGMPLLLQLSEAGGPWLRQSRPPAPPTLVQTVCILSSLGVTGSRGQVWGGRAEQGAPPPDSGLTAPPVLQRMASGPSTSAPA